ncbi:MAG: TolC family protein [Chitinophagales bacterium]
MKAIFLHSIQYLVIVIFFFAGACKPSQTSQGKPLREMPATYQGDTDTANSATINWRKYFSDPLLLSLIDTVLTNNFDLLIAEQRILAAQSGIRFAKGAKAPTVGAGVAASINRYGEYTMNGAGNKNTLIYGEQYIPEYLPDFSVGLQTSWEVDLWGKLGQRKKAATARWLARAEGRNLVITNLVAEVASAYYELMALDQTLSILDGTIVLQENALEIVRVQKEAARANELAVKQFESELLSVRSLKIAIAQEIINTESRINFLAGRFPETIRRDSLRYSPVELPLVKPGVPATLLLNRPDIREAELELEASKADVIAARKEFLPRVNISGAFGWQAFQAGLLFTTPQSIALGVLGSLAAPIINRSAIEAAFERATASQLEALYHYQQTIVNGYLEVYNELNAIRSLQQTVELKSKEAETLTFSIDISADLFRTGRATYLEVLTTQVRALQSKLELVNSRRNQFLATVNIYKALGGGWR